ncbi:MAG: hemolysin family protein [Candidatus Rokuibacteriota bacterium]
MQGTSIEFVLIAVAILANGFFASAEIALVSSRVSRLTELRNKGVRGAATALGLKNTPESFLATIQIAITLVGTLASAVGGAAAAEELAPLLADAGLPATWASTTALAGVILVITYFSLVVGELAPKALALRHSERIACFSARPVAWLNRTASVLVSVLTVSTNVVLRLLGQGRTPESPPVSEDEVKLLIREGAAKGVFEKLEEELVQNVFDFADTTVREIMVPRPNVLGLDVTTPPEEILRAAAAVGRSRMPLYRESLENIVGIVTIKDLFRVCASGASPDLSGLVHPPLYIPETARISVLLGEFQRNRQSLAVVVDEYGSVAGVVTIEDVIEEIVGELPEERETMPAYASHLPDGSYLIDGAAPVRELRETFGLPIEDSVNYTTVGGFIIDKLQTIPRPGDGFSAGGYRWTVVAMEGPRIVKARVEQEGRRRVSA